MRTLIKLIPFVFILILVLLPVFIRQNYFTDEADGKAEFVLATGEEGGIYNPLGKAIAILMNRDFERHHITSVKSEGTVDNIKKMNAGADFAFLQGDIVKLARENSVGLPDASDIRGILVLYKEFLQIFVRTDSEIEKLSDLRGKIVSVGSRGSATVYNARTVCETIGIDFEYDISKRYYPLVYSLEELDKGTVDAVFFFGGRTIYEVDKAGKRGKIRMLSIPKPVINRIIDSDYPFLNFQITNADYSFIETPVTTLGQVAILACRKDVPSWIVGRIRQQVILGTDDLQFAHPIASEIKTIDQSLMPIPFHNSIKDVSDERLEFFSIAIILAVAVLLMAFIITMNVVLPQSFQRFRYAILNFNRSYVSIIIIMLLFLVLTVFLGAYIVQQAESNIPGTQYSDYSHSLKNMLYTVIYSFDNKYMPGSAYSKMIINILFMTYLLILVLLTVSIMAILFKPRSKLNPMQFLIERDRKKIALGKAKTASLNTPMSTITKDDS